MYGWQAGSIHPTGMLSCFNDGYCQFILTLTLLFPDCLEGSVVKVLNGLVHHPKLKFGDFIPSSCRV